MCGRTYFWIFELSIFRQKNRKIKENLPGCFLPFLFAFILELGLIYIGITKGKCHFQRVGGKL